MLDKFIRSPKNANGCRVCGTCCELYGHTVRADPEDFARWQREGRGEIIAWANTEGDERPEGCPFLVRPDAKSGFCGIEETKPAMCRAYPTKAHGGWCVMRVKHETGAGGE